MSRLISEINQVDENPLEGNHNNNWHGYVFTIIGLLIGTIIMVFVLNKWKVIPFRTKKENLKVEMTDTGGEQRPVVKSDRSIESVLTVT